MQFFYHCFAKFSDVSYFLYFLFFLVLFKRIDLCIGWLVVFSMSRFLNNEMYSFFLIFLNLIFNFQTSRMSFCYGVPYIVSIFFTF